MFDSFEPAPEWSETYLSHTIQQKLHFLNIPFTLRGHHYHALAILLTVQAKAPLRVTKDIYPTVARRYHSSVSSVERVMRSAILRCWNSDAQKNLQKIAGCALEKRPTNSEFIRLVSRHIQSLL